MWNIACTASLNKFLETHLTCAYFRSLFYQPDWLQLLVLQSTYSIDVVFLKRVLDAALQDFEALTPNLLARIIETVEGGGLIVLLLRSLSSLSSLYTMVMVCFLHPCLLLTPQTAQISLNAFRQSSTEFPCQVLVNTKVLLKWLVFFYISVLLHCLSFCFSKFLTTVFKHCELPLIFMLLIIHTYLVYIVIIVFLLTPFCYWLLVTITYTYFRTCMRGFEQSLILRSLLGLMRGSCYLLHHARPVL